MNSRIKATIQQLCTTLFQSLNSWSLWGEKIIRKSPFYLFRYQFVSHAAKRTVQLMMMLMLTPWMVLPDCITRYWATAVSTQKRSQRCWWRRYGFYCGKSVTEKIKWCPVYADSKAFCVGGILKHSQNASSSTLNSFVYHEKMLAKRDTVNWNMEMRLMQFRCSPIGLATWIGNYFVSLI